MVALRGSRLRCYKISPANDPVSRRETTKYAVVCRGTVKPGSAEELARGVNEVASPVMSSTPGSKAYSLVYSEDNSVVAAMSNFRWSNIPIPEGHATLLVVGVGLHLWRPLRLMRAVRPKNVLGWPLLLMGIVLAAWAVAAVKHRDIQKPTEIISSGPYAFSRNPMYLAWTLIYVAAAVLVNTWWLIIFLPILLLFTHYFVVRQEERQLEQQFGEPYRQYCSRVRRYLSKMGGGTD